MYRLGFGQMCPAGFYHAAVLIMSVDLLLHSFFHTTHFKRRQIIAIGHTFQTVFITTNSREPFYMRIPRRYIFVPDRPIYRITITLRCRKLEVAPALAGTSPHDGFTTYLVATYPVERLLLYIRMFLILHKKVMRILAISIAFADDGVIF